MLSMSDEAIAFPCKGSWNNEELRVVQAAYEGVLRREACAGEVSNLDKERFARKIMALARQGRIDAAELARRCLADHRRPDALLPRPDARRSRQIAVRCRSAAASVPSSR